MADAVIVKGGEIRFKTEEDWLRFQTIIGVTIYDAEIYGECVPLNTFPCARIEGDVITGKKVEERKEGMSEQEEKVNKKVRCEGIFRSVFRGLAEHTGSLSLQKIFEELISFVDGTEDEGKLLLKKLKRLLKNHSVFLVDRH